MPNRLIQEQSPYLLQHAHNPVDWYPWGEEAFKQAEKEDKPVLISIGYSACHWCHVMEKESFENVEIANFMNSNFINIKVDREEYPDVDDFFMNAVQTMTGSGGWPLNVFATFDKSPFYGGTYFPPQPMHNRLSWAQVLERIIQAWNERKNEIITQSNELVNHLKNAAKIATHQRNEPWYISDFDTAFELIMKNADLENGGFGNAPKFPTFSIINFLLEYHIFTKNEKSLKHALLSIDKIIQGGIYDQIGGGISRYATDSAWRVPHFEKMLNDQAMLISTLSDAYKITHNNLYAQIIQQTINFLMHEMMGDEYGFYTAIDADSEGIEGKFYTWTFDEWRKVIKEDKPYIDDFLGIQKQGNWERTNILYQAQSIASIALKYNLSDEEISSEIAYFIPILQAHRNQRKKPLVDDKILLSWNALINFAIAKASDALESDKYRDIAKNHFDWMYQHFKLAQHPKHTYKNGIAKIDANLDDWAYTIQAAIQLSTTLNDIKYYNIAKELLVNAIQIFKMEDNNLFYFSNPNYRQTKVNNTDIYDNVTPSSNSVMAHNMHLVGIIENNSEWIDNGEAILQQLKPFVLDHPSSFSNSLTVAQRQTYLYKKLTFLGNFNNHQQNIFKNKFVPQAYYFFEKQENFVTMPNIKQKDKLNHVMICTKNACFTIETPTHESIENAVF